MKIAEKKSTLSTNSVSSESHEFKIGDVSAIIEILRNRLYSNPIRTLTQEYISNARDSHREAGVPNRPIQITLPTKIDSSLKIRDYGVGLSRERVKDVFVNYGISTKQGSNEQTGGFGLGAKSAWAYSDSFTVTSFYNGEKSTYIAHTGKNKNGVFELISCEETTEPNGVEVQVPVKESDIKLFVNAVYRTTLFWDVKPVIKGITDIEIPHEYKNCLINPKWNSDSFIVINNTEFTSEILDGGRDYYNSSKIFLLIDDIPYSLNGHQTVNVKTLCDILYSSSLPNRPLVLIKVKNGEISVSASRESIAKEEDNTAKIESLSQDCIKELTDHVNRSLNNKQDSLKDYYKNYIDLWNLVDLSFFPEESKNTFRFDYLVEDLKFSFDFDRRLSSESFSHIVYYRLVKKRVLSRIQQQTCNFIDYKKNNIKIVINDLPEDNENITSKRIRNLIEMEGYSGVYLIDLNTSEEQSELIFKTFNSILLSDLEIPKKSYKRTSGGSKVKDKKEVTIRSVDDIGLYSNKISCSEVRTISIEDLEAECEEVNKLYVLIPLSLSERKIEDMDLGRYWKFIQSYKGVKFYRCGVSDMKKITEANLDKIISFDAFQYDLESYCPISDEQFNKTFQQNYCDSIKSLRAYRNKIKCEFTLYLLDVYDKFVVSNDTIVGKFHGMDDFLKENYSNYRDVLDNHKNVKELHEKFEKMYPLFTRRGWIRQEEFEEWIYYINGKCIAEGTNPPDESVEAKKILDKMVKC